MQFATLSAVVALLALPLVGSAAAPADANNQEPSSSARRAETPLKFVQEQRWFTYVEKATFGSDTPIKLEVLASEPTVKWNGKIVVINHGSTGIGHNGRPYDEKYIKTPIKFVRVAPALAARGYRVFVLMRKGRGNSEGRFTEEDARTCGWGDQMQGVTEAEPQLDQFVDWVRTEYKVSKVVVMGHSRGGFLSSYYSAKHPDKVSHAVNISGGWTTVCESKNNMTHRMLDESGEQFKNQTWVYADKDSFFSERDLSDYADIAAKSGINFIPLVTPAGDGHAYATANPKLWLNQIDSALRK